MLDESKQKKLARGLLSRWGKTKKKTADGLREALKHTLTVGDLITALKDADPKMPVFIEVYTEAQKDGTLTLESEPLVHTSELHFCDKYDNQVFVVSASRPEVFKAYKKEVMDDGDDEPTMPDNVIKFRRPSTH